MDVFPVTMTDDDDIRTVQATFKVISVWRDRGAFVTFLFSMRRV